MAKQMIAVDANEATARIAHKVSEVVAIYPITPSTPMAELSDGSTFSFSQGATEISFGMGLELYTWHGHTVPAKNGAISGYSALFFAFPPSKIAVAVLTNLSGSDQAMHRIARRAAAILSSGALPE